MINDMQRAMDTIQRMQRGSVFEVMSAIEYMLAIGVDTLNRGDIAKLCTISKPTVYKLLDCLEVTDWIEVYPTGNRSNAAYEVYIKSNDVMLAMCQYSAADHETIASVLDEYFEWKASKRDHLYKNSSLVGELK